MSVKIGDYNFEGPFATTDSLQNRSGVYAILDRRSDGKLYVTDVGESATVKERVEKHDRKVCWTRHVQGSIIYAAYYTPALQQSGRMVVEQKLRQKYDPKCGKQ